MKRLNIFCAYFLLAASFCVWAGVLELGAPFMDGAVLQREKPICVWGKAPAQEEVEVCFKGGRVRAKADDSGKWKLFLPAQKADAQGAVLTVSCGGEMRVLNDVLVGEVWFCSGQSNMEWTVRLSANAQEEIAAADNPLIRHLRCPKDFSGSPRDFVPANKNFFWAKATPENAGNFSATAYYFARDLQAALGVPVGIIDASFGGKMIEVFLSAEAVESDPAFAVLFARWEKEKAGLPKAIASYEKRLEAWRQAREKARTEGKEFGVFAPMKPSEKIVAQHRPSSVFNAMVAPFIPYTVRGVLWYQGEHNISRAAEYEKLMAAMVADWRAKFGQGDIPFYWVQLARYGAPLDKSREGFSKLREAQRQAAAHIPQSAMAVSLDLGEEGNVHYKNKQEVGRRLSLIAQAKTYGRGVPFSGPAFLSGRAQNGGVFVAFDFAQGLADTGAGLQSFELAGSDGRFEPAQARFQGEGVFVESEKVASPVWVRYAWGNAAKGGLVNAAGLPASPFVERVQ